MDEQAHVDVPMTPIQVQILAGLEQKVTTAHREREIALATLLAGHGISDAQVVGFDFQAGTVRIKKRSAVADIDR